VNWELQKQLNPAIGPTVDIFEAVEWLRSDDDGGEWTIDSFSPIHQLNQGVQQAETGFERRDAKATAEGIHNSEKGFLATAMLFLGPGAGGAEAAGGIARPKGVPADWVAKPSKTGGGTRFVDPANPHNSVAGHARRPQESVPQLAATIREASEGRAVVGCERQRRSQEHARSAHPSRGLRLAILMAMARPDRQ